MRVYCDRIANPNSNIIEKATFDICDGRIHFLDKVESGSVHANVILRNAVAFPGLINTHDHLKYSWYKRIGYGTEVSENQKHYANVYQWLQDLYNQYDCIIKKDFENLDLLFELGLYKQIFSATTTVVNHSRHRKNVLSPEKEYIRIFDDFERELVVQPELLTGVTKHPVSFGQSIKEAHNKAMGGNSKKPFIIHAAEGTDPDTAREIELLNELGVLTPETILVHCINTSEDDLNLIAKGGCTLVWCPYTSKYVIGRTANIPLVIRKKINLCIGTDSSCSGSRDLLAELRYAKKLYPERYGDKISNSDLFDMVTINAAKALMIDNECGEIRDGYRADIAIVDSTSSDPYEDIINSQWESIIAVISNGRFIYGDDYIAKMMPKYDNTIYTNFTIKGRNKVIVGDPSKVVTSIIKRYNIEPSALFSFIPPELQNIKGAIGN